MTQQGGRFHKWTIAAVALMLVVITVSAIYAYRINLEKQANALLLMEQGITQFKQKQYETALETLRSIPQAAVEDWRLPYFTGSTLVKLKDYESAAVSLEQALILNSNEKDIPFALGVVYFKLGNLSLSKSYFHSVLELDPGNQDARGLMDIMAKLERQQHGKLNPESDNEEMPIAQ